MEESIARTIKRLASWAALKQFRENATLSKRLTPEISEALNRRSFELGKVLVAQRTGLDLSALSLAESKIIDAVSEYVGIKTAQGSHAQRTFDQLKNVGLIRAAEASVCRGSPTEGFKTLADANRSELSYEQIIVDHPDEFSARAIWYARRALRLTNASDRPPVRESGDTQTRTHALVTWLKQAAQDNDGVIPPFTNEDAAAAMDMADMVKYGRVHGNIQSRIDFACYKVGTPPLGLAAEEPFNNAWGQQDRDWVFPVASMQKAAQLKEWADVEFDEIVRETERLPGQAHLLWKAALSADEARVKDWAFSFGSDVQFSEEMKAAVKANRNVRWARDELILALDLYMRHRAEPRPKEAPEIVELSGVLNRLGRVFGQKHSSTYRNPNGVYMKLMNFRRHDPKYASEGKTGLTRGNKDEAVVWAEFAHDPTRLAQVAAFIRNGIVEHAENADLAGPDDPGIVEAEEGKVATRVHTFRERNRRLVAQAKAEALRKHGRLFCAACSFDFTKRYGEAGFGIIDVHHTKPIHTMQPGEKTKVVDLALLCSNCHRVVHSKRRWLTVDQVKASLEG